MLRVAFADLIQPPAEGRPWRHVFFNGEVLGRTDDAEAYAASVRASPVLRELPIHLSPSVFVTPSGHVHIQTDEGRLVRPLLRWPLLEDRNRYRTASIPDLLAEGALRYVDAAEVNTLDVCIDPVSPEPDRHYDLAEVHAILCGRLLRKAPGVDARHHGGVNPAWAFFSGFKKKDA